MPLGTVQIQSNERAHIEEAFSNLRDDVDRELDLLRRDVSSEDTSAQVQVRTVQGNQGIQGERGIQGEQGVPGPGGVATRVVVSAVTGEAINATSLVYQAADNRVFNADNTVLSHADKILGVALQSVISGGTVDVLLFGQFVDTAFSIYPNDSLLYLNGLGIISATPPTTGFSVAVGKHTDASTFNVDLRTPIFLV